MSVDVERLVAGIHEYLGKAFAPLVKRLLSIELRLRALEEQQKDLTYRGTWEAGVEYRNGNFVTDGGSVWHCKRTTTQRPGPGDAWQLAVKRGQDGRDAR